MGLPEAGAVAGGIEPPATALLRPRDGLRHWGETSEPPVGIIADRKRAGR